MANDNLQNCKNVKNLNVTLSWLLLSQSFRGIESGDFPHLPLLRIFGCCLESKFCVPVSHIRCELIFQSDNISVEKDISTF